MKKGIQIFLGLVIVALIYVIADMIHTPLKFEQQLKERNAEVIVKLKDIRSAERAFKTKYQRFTNDFDSLITFILTDSLEMERKLVDEDDSVAMAFGYGNVFHNRTFGRLRIYGSCHYRFRPHIQKGWLIR